MKLWSLHPRHMDHTRLLALWRTALAARDIIEGRASDYRVDRSIYRFMGRLDSDRAINTYIYYIWLEAKGRGYRFAREEALKKELIDTEIKIPVTSGQLLFEAWKLLTKISQTNPDWISRLAIEKCFEANPVFRVVEGLPDPREKISRTALNMIHRGFPFKGIEIPIKICL